MDIEYINKRISMEICYNSINKLKDENLLNRYKQYNSVKNKIDILKDILTKYSIDSQISESIINDYLINLIPPGTKAVIRGVFFNEIVKQTILDMNLNKKYDIFFEKQCPKFNTFEKPDWYILDKNTDKIIIGMNQLDLWSGGLKNT